jgi:L-threonylcarbamoyladenylate synthase
VSEIDIPALRDVLLGGELAIMPTDTVYGLACALDSPEGVDALYALKGRPREQACQVLVYADPLLDEALANLDEVTVRAVRALLPGPATCLVPDPTGRFAAAAGHAPGTVGLRMPAMSGSLRELDIPLVATSANDPGGQDPATVEDVPPAVRTAVFATIDVGRLTPVPSAVVDLREVGGDGFAWLLRPGPHPEKVVETLAAVGVGLASRG